MNSISDEIRFTDAHNNWAGELFDFYTSKGFILLRYHTARGRRDNLFLKTLTLDGVLL